MSSGLVIQVTPLDIDMYDPDLMDHEAWSANRGNSQWMQFKLDKDTLISGVAIQKKIISSVSHSN